MPTNHGPGADEQCTCDNPREFRLNQLLVHGVAMKCTSCGGVYHLIDDHAVLNPLVDELPLSGPADVTLTIDGTVLDHGDE